jgi:hypothetical protein
MLISPTQGVTHDLGRHLPKATQHVFHPSPGCAMRRAAGAPTIEGGAVGGGQGFGLEAHQPAGRLFQDGGVDGGVMGADHAACT